MTLKFILYSATNEDTVSNSLGQPEYSYYFVYKGYKRQLEALGEVVTVEDPENDVDIIYRDCKIKGQACVFVCFAPPNKLPRGLQCPMVPVFAWEFDSLPSAAQGMAGDEDWVEALQLAGRAVCLSNHTRSVVQAALGDDFDVVAIPVPMLDSGIDDIETQSEAVNLTLDGTLIDSREYDFNHDAIVPRSAMETFPLQPLVGTSIELDFSRRVDNPPLLCGFYEAEAWGAWTSHTKAWVLLPNSVSGKLILRLKCMAYGANIGRPITVSIGDSSQDMVVEAGTQDIELEFSVKSAANILTFANLDAVSVAGAPDPRSMALGLMSASLELQGVAKELVEPLAPRSLTLSGRVYTSVLNPKCGRKNWLDIITGFCWAFKEDAEVTLFLKVSARQLSDYFNKYHQLLARLQPFKCRVVLFDGYLSAHDYTKLVTATDIYVNASKAEGLCLPLMEFMSYGVPVIAPRHTAMSDYVSEDCAFVVGTSQELTVWPHDENELYSCTRYRIDWHSLFDRYTESMKVMRTDRPRYEAMSQAAKEQVFQFASDEVVKTKLMDFFLG